MFREIDQELIQHYFCFMDNKTRVGFEVSSDQMIPALAKDSQVERLIDGQWYHFQGVVKDGTCILLGRLMEMFDYAKVDYNMSDDLSKIVNSIKFITQDTINLLVYTLIVQSPMCVEVGLAVDRNALIAARMVIEKLIQRKDYQPFNFIGIMFVNALNKFVSTVDGHTVKVLYQISH